MSTTDAPSNQPPDYVPPKVWSVEDSNLGGELSKMNRPTAGARSEKELPVGKHPLQLYSLATPNGVKVTILLEELLELGVTGAEYDAWLVHIGNLEQFTSGFVQLNPNSKIPALRDYSPAQKKKDGDQEDEKNEPIDVFESGSILVYLADKFGKFLPSNEEDVRTRTEAMNWLMFQMGSAPYVGGGFGHFFKYAPIKIQYAIDRFTMETKRQLDVLNQQLADRMYVTGDTYTIADIALWSWHGQIVLDQLYDQSAKFLDATASYPNVIRWAKEIAARPAVQRGIKVNKVWGPSEGQLKERHAASDFETKD